MSRCDCLTLISMRSMSALRAVSHSVITQLKETFINQFCFTVASWFLYYVFRYVCKNVIKDYFLIVFCTNSTSCISCEVATFTTYHFHMIRHTNFIRNYFRVFQLDNDGVIPRLFVVVCTNNQFFYRINRKIHSDLKI